MSQGPRMLREPGRHVLPGVIVGGLVGLADTLHTAQLGFLQHLDDLELWVFFVTGIGLMASLGAVSGGVLGLCEAALARISVHIDDNGDLRHRERVLMSSRSHLPVAATWMLLASSASLAFLVRHLPLGVERGTLLAGAAVVGVLVIPSATMAARSWPSVNRLCWAGLAVAAFWLCSEVLYPYSHQVRAGYIYLVGVANLYVVGIVAAHRVRRSVRGPHLGWRLPLLALIVSLGVLMWIGPSFARHSHRVRLALIGRTALVYRPLQVTWFAGRSTQVPGAADGAAPLPPRAASLGPALQPAGPPVRGVLLILVDAFRDDRIGRTARRPMSLTPVLDDFSQNAVRFRQAYTTLPATEGATSSLVTSRYPRVDDNTMRDHSLGTILRGHAVRTIAISGHPLLERAMGNLDTYELLGTAVEQRGRLSSPLVVDRALHHLDALAVNDRFLLVAHFYDPHADYLPNSMVNFGSDPVDRYDAEIAYTDHHIGRLLEGLHARGLDRSTAVIVVSDHGEEFGDHRYMLHRMRLYDESARIALIIATPREPGGRQVWGPVSILDLAPTILQMLGLPVAPGMTGRSLLHAGLDGTPLEGAVFMRSARRTTAAVVVGHRKLIFDVRSNLLEYYDMAADPLELNNLADDNPPQMQAMAGALQDFLVEQGFFKDTPPVP